MKKIGKASTKLLKEQERLLHQLNLCQTQFSDAERIAANNLEQIRNLQDALSDIQIGLERCELIPTRRYDISDHSTITQTIQEILYSHNIRVHGLYCDWNAMGDRNIYGKGIKFWNVNADSVYKLEKVKEIINSFLRPYNLFIADHFFNRTRPIWNGYRYTYNSQTIHSLVVYQK